MEKYKELKETDLKVSPIALGTVKAGLAWNGAEADRIFDYFLDHGGNLIDTARVYYDWIGTEKGRSERVIGEWFRRSGKRNEVVLMTKGGHPNKDTMHVSRLGQADMEYDLDLSLKTLGTDCIDIYFYHRDDVNRSIAELLERMEAFKKKGKIRYYGCSNWSTKRMEEAEQYAKNHGLTGFIANQNLYNIGTKYMKPFEDDTMVTVDEKALKFYARSHNTPMPYFGICSGFFHKLKENGAEDVKDSCYYTEGNKNVALGIDKICQKYQCSITQALLGFFMVQDFTMIPLAGASSLEQLKDIVKTTDIPFTKDDYSFV